MESLNRHDDLKTFEIMCDIIAGKIPTEETLQYVYDVLSKIDDLPNDLWKDERTRNAYSSIAGHLYVFCMLYSRYFPD